MAISRVTARWIVLHADHDMVPGRLVASIEGPERFLRSHTLKYSRDLGIGIGHPAAAFVSSLVAIGIMAAAWKLSPSRE